MGDLDLACGDSESGFDSEVDDIDSSLYYLSFLLERSVRVARCAMTPPDTWEEAQLRADGLARSA